MNDADREDNFGKFRSAWSVMKALSLELKSVEYALGVSPQGRAALKLDWPTNQADRETPDEGDDPADPAEL